MKSRTWHDWYEAQADTDAQQCKRRLTAGETGNPSNPALACQHSYEAGVHEGERRAAARLTQLLLGRCDEDNERPRAPVAAESECAAPPGPCVSHIAYTELQTKVDQALKLVDRLAEHRRYCASEFIEDVRLLLDDGNKVGT